MSDISANGLYNNFHEVVDIIQSPPKVISARCYCVPPYTQYYFGSDQVQSEGEACPCHYGPSLEKNFSLLFHYW